MSEISRFKAKQIAEYMLVETELRPADLCMIFGGENAEHLADHAAKLYKQGLFKKIIVSGGVITSRGMLEADIMQARLIGWGVPEQDIIVEDKATNTGENVRYSLKLLEKEIGLKNIKSVIAIGQIHASRRFLMTLEKYCPKVTKMFSTPNYYPVARKDWYKDKKFKEDVLREYNKIESYIKQGFIKEIDMQEITRKIKKLSPANDNKAVGNKQRKTNNFKNRFNR